MKILNGLEYHEPYKIYKKYELTDDTIVHNGRVLKRIRALMSFGNIPVGTLGGYVESIGNLSQEGFCWVYPNAKVYDDAFIYGNIQVDGVADISGHAKLLGYGRITDRVVIRDNVSLWGELYAEGIATLKGNVKLYGRVQIKDASIMDNVILYGVSNICGHTLIKGDTQLVNANMSS